MCTLNILLFEPAHDKTYNKMCATSEDSDQPAHQRSLVAVFTDYMCFLQPPGKKGYIATDKAIFFIRKMLISFLFLNKNICCGYSLEAPRRGASNEYPQHMFSSINKKNIMWIPPLICSYGDKLEPLSYWVDVQADPSLSWSYRSIVGFVLHWIILKRSSLNYPHLPPELNSTLTQSIKSAMNPTILGGFYPKSTLNYIL